MYNARPVPNNNAAKPCLIIESFSRSKAKTAILIIITVKKHGVVNNNTSDILNQKPFILVRYNSIGAKINIVNAKNRFISQLHFVVIFLRILFTPFIFLRPE